MERREFIMGLLALASAKSLPLPIGAEQIIGKPIKLDYNKQFFNIFIKWGDDGKIQSFKWEKAPKSEARMAA